MTTSGCGEPGAVGGMAVELFQLASLLTGNEAQALRLVEDSLATLEIDPCLDPEQARAQARRAVVHTALVQLATAEPAALAASGAAPADHDPCVQDDDLRSAGLTERDLQAWLNQEQTPTVREGLRSWIEALPATQRIVFVQRAVLGQGNEAALSQLREAWGEPGAAWTPQVVGQAFRQALCSLANAMAHAPQVAAAEPA